ncbi:hypothetical protein, conserved [Babesia ovata]|uniref:C3H1-type domain-containing protein n=1 Tax=Babesia ovata TaxID=189622 RepID=A0A2H6KJP2_9APIC|nr:uncharacterized protein BOVATA_047080 [Babesia ovata]GBE63215.1 hypothetical protein, conserved [Babesia ovata]
MAFLHSVLKDVHDKQPYKVGKDYLNENVVKLLNGKLCLGHNGFKRVIETVAQGVGEYNKEVEGSNESVKTIITGMQRNMESLQTQVSEILNDNLVAGDPELKKAKRNVDLVLRECKLHAETFLAHIGSAQNKILDFNNDCKTSVINSKNNIWYAASRLRSLSDKELRHFTATKSSIVGALEFLKSAVDKKIRVKVTALVEQLKGAVSDILRQLNNIYHQLETYVHEMENLLEEADMIFKSTMHDVNAIIMQEPGKNIREIIDGKAGQLKSYGEWLGKYIEDVTRLTGHVRVEVNGLEDKLKEDLGMLRSKIKAAVTEYAKDYVTKVHNEVKLIKGKSKDQGLQGFVEHVKDTYAANFKEPSTFGGVVQRWIDEILKSDVVVKESMKLYVGSNDDDKFNDKWDRGTNTISTDHTGSVATLITNQLRGDVITQAVDAAKRLAQRAENTIQKNLDYVQSVCEQFAKQLDKKFKKAEDIVADQTYKGIGAVAKTIADQVDTVFLKGPEHKKDGYDNHFLTTAIEATLAALTHVARQFADELKSLTGTNAEEIKKVDDAYGKAGELDGELGAALRSTAGTYNIDHSVSIKDPIHEKFSGKVEEQFKKTHSGVVGDGKDINLAQAATQYNTYKTSKVDDAVTNAINKAKEITVNDANAELTDFSQKIKDNLNVLLEAFSHTGIAVNDRLERLKTLLYNVEVTINNKDQKGMNEIKNELKRLYKTLLDGPARDAQNFLKNAEHLRDSTINKLNEDVTQQVNETILYLTTRARRNYVTSVKALLKAFAAKATQELQALPAAIEEDLRIGFKGFMRKVQGEFNGNETSDVNIKRLQNGYDLQSLCNGFERFYAPLHTYLLAEVKRLHKEECEKNQKTTTEEAHYSDKLTAIYSALTALTSHIHSTNRYDYQLPSKLTAVQSAINALTPNGFSNPNTAILDGLTEGLRKFVEQLNKAYISRYDGATAIKEWEADGPKKEDGSDNKILTQDGRNGAKVFLTCVRTLFNELYNVYYHGGHKWRSQEIQGKGNETKYKEFLHNSGYDVVNLITKDNTGWNVSIRLAKAFKKHQEFSEYPDKFNSVNDCMDHFSKHQGLLSRLFDHLEQYYQKQYNLPSAELPAALHPRMSDTIQSPLKPSHLIDALGRSCAYAQDSLIAILGHGHEGGRYAVEFNTNTDNLDYPSSPAKCFDLLLEISSRVYNQMRFLYSQCQNGPSRGGWADCWYGRGVAGSSWNCNTLQCPDQPYNQIGEQKHNQTCSQKCNQTVECGLKSPLQSFLEDGLQGFLPHTLTKLGCGVECSVGKHRGLPCKTPMGFGDICVTASHTKNGEFLKKVLHSFCGQEKSHLSKFCGIVNCLMQRPPQTLGDMFAFYYGYLENWEGGDKGKDTLSKKHKHDAFEKAVKEACFGSTFEFNLISIFESTRHSGKHITHEKGDLFRIVQCPYSLEDTCGFF